jgi:hypothetical protein
VRVQPEAAFLHAACQVQLAHPVQRQSLENVFHRTTAVALIAPEVVQVQQQIGVGRLADRSEELAVSHLARLAGAGSCTPVSKATGRCSR